MKIPRIFLLLVLLSLSACIPVAPSGASLSGPPPPFKTGNLWWYSERLELIRTELPNDVWFTVGGSPNSLSIYYENTGAMLVVYEGQHRAVEIGAPVSAYPDFLVIRNHLDAYQFPIEVRNVWAVKRPPDPNLPDPQDVELTFIRRGEPFTATLEVSYVLNRDYSTGEKGKSRATGVSSLLLSLLTVGILLFTGAIVIISTVTLVFWVLRLVSRLIHAKA